MFYDVFKRLCDEKGISCNRAATEMGLSNATATKWKKTGATPSGDTLSKIAVYFDVSIDDLLGNEEKPAPESRNGLSIKEQKDIARKLEKMMDELEESGDLMFDGDPASEEAKESIRNALAMGLEYARKVNREKYNPYKNKKEKD